MIRAELGGGCSSMGAWAGGWDDAYCCSVVGAGSGHAWGNKSQCASLHAVDGLSVLL